MRPLPGLTFGTVVATGVAIASAPGFAQAPEKFPSKRVRVVIAFAICMGVERCRVSILPSAYRRASTGPQRARECRGYLLSSG